MEKKKVTLEISELGPECIWVRIDKEIISEHLKLIELLQENKDIEVSEFLVDEIFKVKRSNDFKITVKKEIFNTTLLKIIAVVENYFSAKECYAEIKVSIKKEILCSEEARQSWENFKKRVKEKRRQEDLN